jgi:hypothetical protein
MSTTQPRGGQILDGSLTDADIAAANKDGAAGTASLRTLGTGAQQACAGNDTRLSDTRTPSAFNLLTGTLLHVTDLLPFYSLVAGANGQATIEAFLGLFNRGYIDGFIMSNDGASPLTKVDIGSGCCVDATNAALINSTVSITKDISATFAVGSGNGGMFTGSVAASTVYHVFAIRKTSNLAIDFGFDTSVTAAHIPTGYGFPRRIGSVITDASSHILPFHQYGNEFWWDTSLLDINVVNPGTSAVTRTLTVPTGLKVKAIMTAYLYDNSQYTALYLSCLDSVDLAPSATTAVETEPSATVAEGAQEIQVWTNTSAQIRSRVGVSGANTDLRIRTLGWIDPRGLNQ